jgi:hypothetical protein
LYLIDDVRMYSFIILNSVSDCRTELFDIEISTHKKGQCVKVINGIYKGAEGYIKINKSDRKLLVFLNGGSVTFSVSLV